MSLASNSPEAKIVGKNRIKAMAFFTLAAVVGVAGLFLVMQYMDQIKAAALGARDKNGEAIDTVLVVVSAVPLPIATEIEAKHLKVVKWPADNVPEGSHTYIKSLVGRTTIQAMVKDEPVLESRLATADNAGMAALLAKGKRAMAVKVDSVVGVAGFVRPGDYVDVITTMTPDNETRIQLENDAAKISKIILQNIKVLAVGEHLETKNREPTKVKVVTLEVDAVQSEKLALGSQHGQLQLTMRSRIDQEEEETPGVTPFALLVPEYLLDTDTELDTAEQRLAENEKPEIKHRPKTRRHLRVKHEEEVIKKKPDAPVVEILRGSSIETRKLLVSADDN